MGFEPTAQSLSPCRPSSAGYRCTIRPRPRNIVSTHQTPATLASASVLTATTCAEMVGVPAARAVAEHVVRNNEHASVFLLLEADAESVMADFEQPTTTSSTADASEGPLVQVNASAAAFARLPLEVAGHRRQPFQSLGFRPQETHASDDNSYYLAALAGTTSSSPACPPARRAPNWRRPWPRRCSTRSWACACCPW